MYTEVWRRIEAHGICSEEYIGCNKVQGTYMLDVQPWKKEEGGTASGKKRAQGQ